MFCAPAIPDPIDRGTEPYYRVRDLIGDGATNHKQSLGLALHPEYCPANLSLAPEGASGYSVCRFATPGCGGGLCTFAAGRGNQVGTRRARIARTRLLFQDRELFAAKLWHELEVLRRRARGLGRTLAVRLNTFSDFPWEARRRWRPLFDHFDDVQFMDYTKDARRLFAEDLPRNYDLTFSLSEENRAEAIGVLRGGGNVCAVFGVEAGGPLPGTWEGFEVIDGDRHDYRFLDPRPRVVGVRAKGWRIRGDDTGFVLRPPFPP